jgi:carnitine-CoA ligase
MPTYATIGRVLAAAAERDAGDVWLRSEDGELTFGAAAAAVAVTASRLAAAGVRAGDRVMLTSRSTPAYLVGWLSVAWLGATSVPTNPALSATELSGLLAQVEPHALVTDAELLGTDGLAVPPATRVLQVGELTDGWSDPSVSSLAVGAPGPADVDETDVAVLLPTSGTTGRSKLVMQTHRAYSMAGEGFPYWMELDREDRMMTSLPLFHVNALAYSTMGSLTLGCGLVLVPRFSASKFLGWARSYGATQFNAIGAMLEILMRQPEQADDAGTPLRLCYTGPSPAKERQLEMEARLGLRIVCGYAMSETTYGMVWPHGTRPYGTLGRPRQHPRTGEVNHARVVDESGADLPPGEVGELWLSNPAVTPGYWGMPEETEAVLTDGWLHTGDLVVVGDDGMYTFVGRRKEVLRRRGENLSPLEVEEAVAAHPDVAEVAVVGVPSELSEDDVKAFVVAKADGDLDLVALRDFAAERLARFKVPRYWQQLAELPHTPTGRVAKHQLPPGHPDGELDLEDR